MSIPRVSPSTIYHLLSTRTEQLLFALFVFTLPLQIRWFFKDVSAFIDGEWVQAWVWLSDVVLLALLSFWVWRKGHGAFRALWPILLATPIFGFAAISYNPILSIWTAVKIAEALALFSYVRANREIIYSRPVVGALIAIVMIMAATAIGQFYFQHDLGLQEIGESELSPDLRAVAKFELEDGAKLMRAYGLAPHPNIAAVLFLAGVLGLAYVYIKRGVGLVWKFSLIRLRSELMLGLALFFLMLALAVTFSRSAWMALAAGTLVFVVGILVTPRIRRMYLWETLRFGALILTIITLLYVSVPGMHERAGIDSKEQAVTLRKFFNEKAIEMIKEEPLLGVGPGRFVEELAIGNLIVFPDQTLTLGPVFLQPVHNVPLLLAVEYGIPFAAALLLATLILVMRAVARVWREQDPQKALCGVALCSLVVALVPLMAFDHFLWTLQQGRLSLFFLLGLL